MQNVTSFLPRLFPFELYSPRESDAHDGDVTGFIFLSQGTIDSAMRFTRPAAYILSRFRLTIVNKIARRLQVFFLLKHRAVGRHPLFLLFPLSHIHSLFLSPFFSIFLSLFR